MLILATYRNAEGEELKTGFSFKGVEEIVKMAPTGCTEIDVKIRLDLDPLKNGKSACVPTAQNDNGTHK